MRPARLAITAVLALLGAIWFLQGVGVIGGSVMSGSLFWAFVGVVLVIAAGFLFLMERRRGSGTGGAS
jgi:hypothetical protein